MATIDEVAEEEVISAWRERERYLFIPPTPRLTRALSSDAKELEEIIKPDESWFENSRYGPYHRAAIGEGDALSMDVAADGHGRVHPLDVGLIY